MLQTSTPDISDHDADDDTLLNAIHASLDMHPRPFQQLQSYER